MSNAHILEKDIQAFDAAQADLLARYKGKFVVFHGGVFFGSFDTVDNAARSALRQFGNEPFLLRQVEEFRVTPLPTSIAFQQLNAAY